MITFDDLRDIERFVIAQADTGDYSESGWVAVAMGKTAALANYSHCSCDGTWTVLRVDGKLKWDWQGTLAQLVKLAKRRADPTMPERKANSEDYDYGFLMKVYDQILEWDRNGRKVVG